MGPVFIVMMRLVMGSNPILNSPVPLWAEVPVGRVEILVAWNARRRRIRPAEWNRRPPPPPAAPGSNSIFTVTISLVGVYGTIFTENA